MPPTQAPLGHRQAAQAVQLWARTVRTLRNHGDVERLSRDVLRRAGRELADLLATQDLVIEFGRDGVLHAGELVLRVGPTDVPFGLLAESGVGTLELAAGTPSDEIERLLRTCAAAPGIVDPIYDLARELRRSELPNLELRAPAAGSPATGASRTGPEIDWWLLPEPRPTTELGHLIERELAANRPTRVVDLLLAELATDDAEDTTIGGHLLRLLEIMLQRDDAAGATELLQRAEHTPGVAPQVVMQLRRRGMRALRSDWLGRQLRDAPDQSGVLALAMQLGDDAVRWVAQAAAALDVTLPAWVAAMLGPLE